MSEDTQGTAGVTDVSALSTREKWKRLLRPRRTRGQVLISILALLVGFTLVTTVRAQGSPEALEQARQEDLVRILQDLSQRSDRLRVEASRLQREYDELVGASDTADRALEDARRRLDVLGILAGTAPAEGPGIELEIRDPAGEVLADVLLDTIEELRDAGAEAMQINGVRVVASTYVADAGDGIVVDGQAITSPYVFTVLGDPHTLATALRIPGGVLDVVAQHESASAEVTQDEQLVVDALKAPTTPRYARPAPTAD